MVDPILAVFGGLIFVRSCSSVLSLMRFMKRGVRPLQVTTTNIGFSFFLPRRALVMRRNSMRHATTPRLAKHHEAPEKSASQCFCQKRSLILVESESYRTPAPHRPPRLPVYLNHHMLTVRDDSPHCYRFEIDRVDSLDLFVLPCHFYLFFFVPRRALGMRGNATLGQNSPNATRQRSAVTRATLR